MFLDATQLDYKTVPMLSETSALISQCKSKYLFPWKHLSFERELSHPVLIIEMMILKNLKDLERTQILITWPI